MNSNFFKFYSSAIFFIIVLIIFLSIFFIPLIPSSYKENYNLNNEFIWPIPKFTTITSFFGKRNAPTSGASTFHKGIDIGAPEGTSLIATTNGEITFIGFLGGGRIYDYSYS